MDCANKVAFCRARMCPCNYVGRERECPQRADGCRTDRNVPTVAAVRDMYVKMHGPALSDHCRAVVTELDRLCRTMGIAPTSGVDAIDYDLMERYIGRLAIRNVSKIGALARIHALLGRRERTAYRRAGFDVRPVDMPSVEDDTKAYRTVSEEQSMRVLAWYRSLQFERDGRRRVFAMMMLKYAMRNGDVRRLRWSNFRKSGARWRLEYVPHKTEKSTAGRSVSIWLNPGDQVELAEFRGTAQDSDFVLPRKAGRMGLDGLERSLNKSLRAIGFNGSKGLYELRKMCVDTVFHSLGAEAASAYSGDDFKTVKFHYADPSSLDLHGIGEDAIGRRQ